MPKRPSIKNPATPLVKYNYAVALWVSGATEDSLRQFEEIVALGIDYIAFSETWRRNLVGKETNERYKKLYFKYPAMSYDICKIQFELTSCLYPQSVNRNRKIRFITIHS
jgi:hypothetical protein